MHYVYVLINHDTGKLYVGQTNDLRRRLNEHIKNKTLTTYRLKAYKLIFYEAFLAETDAIRREKYFKTSKGKVSLRQIIRDSVK